MKKLTILLFSILISFGSYGKWSPIVESKFNSVHSVDATSVKINGQYIYYWALESGSKPDMFGALSKAWYIEADCSINKYRILSTILYKSKEGKRRLKTFNSNNPSWSFPTPGTVAYLEVTHMCSSLLK